MDHFDHDVVLTDNHVSVSKMVYRSNEAGPVLTASFLLVWGCQLFLDCSISIASHCLLIGVSPEMMVSPLSCVIFSATRATFLRLREAHGFRLRQGYRVGVPGPCRVAGAVASCVGNQGTERTPCAGLQSILHPKSCSTRGLTLRNAW